MVPPRATKRSRASRGILADIVLAVADDINDGAVAGIGRREQHGVRIVDRLGNVGQPANVPFHLGAAFEFEIHELARFDRTRGDLGVLWRGDDHPGHHGRELSVMPREHRKADAPALACLDGGHHPRIADGLCQADQFLSQLVGVDRVGDIEAGHDVRIGQIVGRKGLLVDDQGDAKGEQPRSGKSFHARLHNGCLCPLGGSAARSGAPRLQRADQREKTVSRPSG